MKSTAMEEEDTFAAKRTKTLIPAVQATTDTMVMILSLLMMILAAQTTNITSITETMTLMNLVHQ